FHTMGNMGQAGEIHHRSRTTNSMGTAIGFLNSVHVAGHCARGRLCQTFEIGLYFWQITIHFFDKRIEYRKFIKCIRHFARTHFFYLHIPLFLIYVNYSGMEPDPDQTAIDFDSDEHLFANADERLEIVLTSGSAASQTL